MLCAPSLAHVPRMAASACTTRGSTPHTLRPPCLAHVPRVAASSCWRFPNQEDGASDFGSHIPEFDLGDADADGSDADSSDADGSAPDADGSGPVRATVHAWPLRNLRHAWLMPPAPSMPGARTTRGHTPHARSATYGLALVPHVATRRTHAPPPTAWRSYHAWTHVACCAPA